MLGTLLLAGAVALTAPATDSTNAVRQVTAYRLSATVGAPTLDGRLDDAVWAAADTIGGFTQREPNEGQPARYRTVMRVAFDNDAVYVAARAYDPEPAKISAQLTRRDEDSSSDWLFVGFDSRHDRRTAYVFAVNPAGVKRDMTIADGANDDTGWDAVWSVAVGRDSLGWTAEYRIPLSALRFATGGDGVWGFQAVRVVQRDNEQSYWAPVKRDEPRQVARFGELRGLRGLPAPRRLELLPYTVSGVTRAPGEAANPFYSSSELRGSAGLDVKYGVTSNLTLDATFNPDFGQVEADPSEVNLSAFETFLSERRPFFTEGADIFRFGIGLGDGDGGNESLFYSRRVGRAPRGGVDVPEGGYADQPGQTNILGAAKLSGQIGRGWSIGVMNALTAEERATILDAGGARSDQVVEPMTNYSVIRARRELNGGKTQFGAVTTGVVRRLDGTGMDWLRSRAFAGGADAQHRWGSDMYSARLWVLGSRIEGSTEAIGNAQRSSARYFQRPGQSYLRFDSAATSLEGWAGSYDVAKVKGKWQGGFLGSVRSPGFETNDLGFQRAADEIVNVFWMQHIQRTPGKVFRDWNLGGNAWEARNFGWERNGRALNVNGSARFLSYWNAWGGVERSFGGWDTRALRGGAAMLEPGGVSGWMGGSSDSRKRLTGNASFNWGVRDEDSGWRYSVSAGMGWRPTPSLRFSASPFYSRYNTAWQYVDAPEVAGTTRYVFAELDQRTFGMSARVNKTFSPTLSLQLYAQPFMSAGRYGSFREPTAPGAGRFADRFTPLTVTRDDEGYDAGAFRFDNPDFSVRDFNLNAVARWEYRPGSTLFLAWSHTRGGSDDVTDGQFRFRRNLDALWNTEAANVVMLKANWWVSF